MAKQVGIPMESLENRLADIRKEINAVDQQLLELFNRRSALSLEVGRIKHGAPGTIFKPLREHDLLDRLAAQNGAMDGPFPEEHLRAIWREILSSSRALQRPQTVAFLGPEGTFSYFAGVEYLGHAAQFQPCRDIAAVFAAVNSGECELGVVPLETSLQGTVGVSFDLFYKYDMCIQAELFSRISHSLLTNCASLTDIRTIYSHPQPLAQCGSWLRTHVPEAALVPVESTAAAARRAAGEQGTAAIGNEKLADLMDLSILEKRIEDEPDNWTRFVIISLRKGLEPPTQAADKTSMIFTVPDKPGALSGILDLLARNGINMRKLESRPLRGQTWKYVFFADVECDMTDPAHTAIVQELGSICNTFRILGSYPTGPQLDRMALGKDEGGEGA